jgi:hypothetical protein
MSALLLLFLFLSSWWWVIFCVAAGLLLTSKLRRFVRHPVAKFLVVLGTAVFVNFLPLIIMCVLIFFPSSSTFVVRLPPAFEVAEVIEVERGSMCDMAAFRYSEGTHRAIAEGGLTWLNSTAQTLVQRNRDLGYINWAPTPHPDRVHNRPGSRWLAGFTCTRDHQALDRELDRALLEPGSYYTHLHRTTRQGLLLVPSRKLIVYFAGE